MKFKVFNIVIDVKTKKKEVEEALSKEGFPQAVRVHRELFGKPPLKQSAEYVRQLQSGQGV